MVAGKKEQELGRKSENMIKRLRKDEGKKKTGTERDGGQTKKGVSRGQGRGL